MITTWHQQVFALDAKYNSQRGANNPSLGMLYIRRRSQLLRDKKCKDPDAQARYLKLRSELLLRRFLATSETRSLPSEKSIELKGRSTLSQRKSGTESFEGVHHIFDQHSAAVSMIKFANNDRSKFCCASFDGTISICEATSSPPKVVEKLQGHQKGVTSIYWSISNDLLVSSSLDTTVRVWRIYSDRKSDCLRVVGDQQRTEVMCCAFAPANNNLVIVGNSLGLLQVFNVSTGKYAREGSVKIGGKILSLVCEESGGSLVWAGNDRGIIISFRLEPGSGRLSKLRRMQGTGRPITSLSWRTRLSINAPWPTVLVSSANEVLLYRVINDHGSLTLWKKYPVNHRQFLVRSTFCPQMGTSLIAIGSEDGSVHLLDYAKDGKAARVTQLIGHSAPVLGLCFNYDESLLATGDHSGLVILWRSNQCQL